MRKLAIAFGCVLALGACQKPDAASTAAGLQATLGAASAASPRLATAAAAVNAKIAAASAKLAQYCTVAQIGLAGASLFGSAGGAVSAARTVVNDFCTTPPSDPVSAYTLVQGAVTDLKAAGITTKSVQRLSLGQASYAEKRLVRLHMQARRLK